MIRCEIQMQHRCRRGTLCPVKDAPLSDVGGSRFTTRLRLEPVGPVNAPDLWLVHKDDQVWPWYGDEKPSLGQVEKSAKLMATRGVSTASTSGSRTTV
jgi:hypothetical protein